MGLQERIESQLTAAFAPDRMRLVNESSQHSVPKGSETHWNLVLVSEAFAGCSLVQRQRAVYGALGGLIGKPIHALTMKVLTPAEWQAAGGDVTNPAPPCLGGSKRDAPPARSP